MADDLRVTIYPEDKVQTFPDPKMGIGSKIIIQRASKVEILDAKVLNIYRTWKESLRELFIEKNIELIGEDSTEPELDTLVVNGMRVKITRVAEVEVTETEPIEYKTIKKTSVDLEQGLTETEQGGINGEKEVKYLVKRVDGEEVSRSVIDTNVLKEPQSKILIIGIGPKYAKSGPYKDTINAAAKRYLINGTALMCLMLRESGGSADAGWPDAQYKGLFQYTEGFWVDASNMAGYGGASIYDANAQINTTAWALTHGYSRRWPPWRYCADK